MPSAKKPKPRRRLRGLAVSKISLVDQPAVDGSVFLIAKRGDDPPEEEVTEQVPVEALMAKLAEVTDKLGDIAESLSKQHIPAAEPEAEPAPAPPPAKAKKSRLALSKVLERLEDSTSRVNGVHDDLRNARGHETLNEDE